MIIATYDSRSFTFEGIGDTEAEAVDVLIQGLRAHAKQYRLEESWWHDLAADEAPLATIENPRRLIEEGIVQVRTIEGGKAYRDREEI